MLGRVNSVYRFFAWGMMPVGAALGGVIVWVVEQGACADLINRPAHAYTRALLAATPRHDQPGQGLEPVPTELIETMIQEAEDV